MKKYLALLPIAFVSLTSTFVQPAHASDTDIVFPSLTPHILDVPFNLPFVPDLTPPDSETEESIPEQDSRIKTGDAEISEWLAENTTEDYNDISALIIDGSSSRFAGLGADENSIYEIASVTKLFTFELLRQAIDEGKTTLDTTYGDITHVTDKPISSVRLEELLTHTSGLPRDLTSKDDTRIYNFFWYENKNPMTVLGKRNVFTLAEEQDLEYRYVESYSNLGVAVLGELVAIILGDSYPNLLQQRILNPLGMHDTFIATTENTNNDSPRGIGLYNEYAEPMIWGTFAPAAGIRSTARDLEKFMRHLFTVPSPWLGTSNFPSTHYDGLGANTYYHNGAATGFLTEFAFNPSSQKAILILNNKGTADTNHTNAIFQLSRKMNQDFLRSSVKSQSNLNKS